MPRLSNNTVELRASNTSDGNTIPMRSSVTGIVRFSAELAMLYRILRLRGWLKFARLCGIAERTGADRQDCVSVIGCRHENRGDSTSYGD